MISKLLTIWLDLVVGGLRIGWPTARHGIHKIADISAFTKFFSVNSSPRELKYLPLFAITSAAKEYR